MVQYGMNRSRSLLLYILCLISLIVAPLPAILPYRPALPPVIADGEEVDTPRDELSPAQEQAMWEAIQRNLALLRSAGTLPAPDAAQVVTYDFPLRLAPGSPDYAGFRVSAFADHNSASGQVLDYNGGERTYDGHHGTDYALYPFSWNKVDAGEVQVIAAAAGTIINKVNADPTDHNPCDGGSSTDNWNYVTVRHADGRLTIYGHLRYNSLTSKAVGQTVTQGEYLGTAASSGNSSGPHLHFEVRTGGFTSNEWVDPYAGPNSQPESLWTTQRPYIDSAINNIATHSAPPATPDPCQPSITNLQDSFTTPRNIYFYLYYRDFQGGLPTQLDIFRPDGSVFQTWQYTSATIFSSAWSAAWVYNFPTDAPSGTWRFEAAYNGQTYETFFNVNAPTTITVTSPNGGEQWNRYLPHSITWTDNLGGEVNIALYRNGVYSATLASNTPSDGEYLWTPDSMLATGPGYSVRITSVISPTVFDASDAPFTLNDGVVIARDDMALTPVNTPITIDALSNDERPNNEALTITAVGSPLTGTVGLVNSKLVYTPTLDFLGTDVFTYTASASTTQATATVTVIVAAEVFEVFLPMVMR